MKLKSKNKEAILGINVKQMCVFESVLFIMEEILVQIYNTLKCKNVKILSNQFKFNLLRYLGVT